MQKITITFYNKKLFAEGDEAIAPVVVIDRNNATGAQAPFLTFTAGFVGVTDSWGYQTYYPADAIEEISCIPMPRRY